MIKRIEAIFKQHRLPKVVGALHKLPTFPGFTTMYALGQEHGHGKDGHIDMESDEGIRYERRICLIVYSEEQDVGAVVQAIVTAAHTGKEGDGIVSVTDAVHVFRISETGAKK